MLKKFLCWILGHKHPQKKPSPFIQVWSLPHERLRYSWALYACKRCIAYPKLEIWTQSEYEDFQGLSDINDSDSDEIAPSNEKLH